MSNALQRLRNIHILKMNKKIIFLKNSVAWNPVEDGDKTHSIFRLAILIKFLVTSDRAKRAWQNESVALSNAIVDVGNS